MPVLFIDLLGVKSRWQRSGKEGVEEVFRRFRAACVGAIRKDADHVWGAVESDSLVLVCSDAAPLLRIAKRLYRDSFDRTGENADNFWFRGVLVGGTPTELRSPKTFRSPLQRVDLYVYSDELLDAIHVERAGFKGMRLIVYRELVTKEVEYAFKLAIEGSDFTPFMRLKNSPYPSRVQSGYVDFLWMAEDDHLRWGRLRNAMAGRLRWSMRNDGAEGFVHAAATQVAFNETSAIIGRIRTLQKRRKAGKSIGTKKGPRKLST